jgi:hypothetical protein
MNPNENRAATLALTEYMKKLAAKFPILSSVEKVEEGLAYRYNSFEGIIGPEDVTLDVNQNSRYKISSSILLNFANVYTGSHPEAVLTTEAAEDFARDFGNRVKYT